MDTPATFGSALGGYSLGNQIGNIAKGQAAASGNILNGTPTSGARGKGVLEGGYSPAVDVPIPPTTDDFLNARVAEAALTDDKGDDLAAAAAVEKFRSEQLIDARATGDPRKIAEAATNLKSATDSVKSLMAQQAEDTNKLADAMKDLAAEMKRSTDFAESVTSTSNFQLTKSLADLVGGQIVGYGVAGRAFTPGTGVEYSY
jgi:hypothetical protein